MFSRRILITITTLLWAGIASADLKVSLYTMSPGPVLFEAFGHGAIVVENTEPGSPVYVYEYGKVETDALFSGVTDMFGAMDAINKLLEETAVTQSSKKVARMMSKPAIPFDLFRRYLANKAVYREVRINELALTQDQAQKFIALMEKDLGQQYEYKSFTDNCVTRIRDHIFTAMGQEAKSVFSTDIHESLQTIVMESVDEAVSLSLSKSLSLLGNGAAVAKAAQGLTMLGLPKEIRATESKKASLIFYEKIRGAANKIDSFMGPAAPIAMNFQSYFFRKELSENPISEYRGLFTPKRLRAALLNTANPATQKPLIDPASEVQLNNKVRENPAEPAAFTEYVQ